jgi:hypothetical protein
MDHTAEVISPGGIPNHMDQLAFATMELSTQKPSG